MMRRRWILHWAILAISGFATPAGAIIDFETVPGTTPSDDLILTTQFLASHGMSFYLDTDGDGLHDGIGPRLEDTLPDGTIAFQNHETGQADSANHRGGLGT